MSTNASSKAEITTAEEKFTGSKTTDNHTSPKVILFLFGTCIIGGEQFKTNVAMGTVYMCRLLSPVLEMPKLKLHC